MPDVAFPFQFDSTGRTAQPLDNDCHIKDMIELLLFTSPGERVNRPDFGSGLQQIVFKANSEELAATLQYTMQAALQRWLGDLIDLESVTVTPVGSKLNIAVVYIVRATNIEETARFTLAGG